MSDIHALQKEIDRVTGLINESSAALHEEVSHISDEFEQSISHRSSYIAYQLQQTVRRGRVREAIIVGGLLGAAWAGVKVYDEVKNRTVQANARKRLVGYYQELTVKQNLVIEEQQQIIRKLYGEAQVLEEDRLKLKGRLDVLTDLLERMAYAQKNRTV